MGANRRWRCQFSGSEIRTRKQFMTAKVATETTLTPPLVPSKPSRSGRATSASRTSLSTPTTSTHRSNASRRLGARPSPRHALFPMQPRKVLETRSAIAACPGARRWRSSPLRTAWPIMTRLICAGGRTRTEQGAKRDPHQLSRGDADAVGRFNECAAATAVVTDRPRRRSAHPGEPNLRQRASHAVGVPP